MARPGLSSKQKKDEGVKLEAIFKAAQGIDPYLTQESFAGEMGITQGLFGQWIKGITAIPDKRLVWLSTRLGFDPIEFRPSIASYGEVMNAELKAPGFRVTAQMSEEPEAQMSPAQLELFNVLDQARRLKEKDFDRLMAVIQAYLNKSQ